MFWGYMLGSRTFWTKVRKSPKSAKLWNFSEKIKKVFEERYRDKLNGKGWNITEILERQIEALPHDYEDWEILKNERFHLKVTVTESKTRSFLNFYTKNRFKSLNHQAIRRPYFTIGITISCTMSCRSCCYETSSNLFLRILNFADFSRIQINDTALCYFLTYIDTSGVLSASL